MKARLNLFISAMLLLIGTGWFFANLLKHPVTQPKSEQRTGASPQGDSPKRGYYFRTSFQNESEFIIHSIVADIAEMAVYAKNHTPPATNALLVTAEEDAAFSATDSPSYTLVVKLPGHSFKYSLQVDAAKSAIWSPEVYAGFTKQLFNALRLNGAPLRPEETSDISTLKLLLNPTAEVIETENQKVSSDLTANFTDPVLHEKAALLVGSFALRENSGYFFDLRSPLCRMTAHLALVRALAGNSSYGANGQVAEALLYTLMNNEKPALNKIAKLNQADPVLAAWSRALTARNTFDYRPLAAANERTLLETFQYFRAYSLAVDTDLSWERLPDTYKLATPDACRIVNLDTRGSTSVQLGHEMLRDSLPLEFKESASVFTLSHKRALASQKEFVAALNELPDRCLGSDATGSPIVHVIGWGQWAMFFQRHLCQTIVQNYKFMAESWGVPEEARKYSEKMDSLFYDLRLYPFVRKMTCRDAGYYHSAVDDSLAVIHQTPQIVSAEIWNQLYYAVPFTACYSPDAWSRVDQWHNHNPPPGTAYNPYPRFDHSNLVRCADSASRIQRMYDLSPYDHDVEYALMANKYKGNATYAQTEEIFRPVLEYDARQMSCLASRAEDDVTQYTEAMSKAAVLDPHYYFVLADKLISHQQQDAAIPYIQKGMDLCSDDVTKSAYTSIMVDYYLKQGRTNDAARIADFGAEVGSAYGFQGKVQYLEAVGRFDEALDYCKQSEERYNDSTPVVKFCVWYKAKTGRSDYDETMARRVRTVFPNGLEKVSPHDFSGPPKDGMVVHGENAATAMADLHIGNVIVGLYGIRVHNAAQYIYARGLDDSAVLDLIVWQNNSYREIKASPANRIFGVDLPDYVAK